ncbi:hypothetical protein GCM10010129_14430 [Streptomyces fumigatiscleroticus]|nr:hypothetical protein GCM10010129_14430 [Streptomyces fumigatiscleroticus]
MSAPTPAPGDDRPREGYYPDPSIPGYVRYWNGAAWVPGTSRPAPQDGEPLAPPPGARPDRPSVEETGPHFFDEDPADAARPGSGPEPASAWGADRSHQSGFGGDQDHRVSWGAPQAADPRVPHASAPADTPPATAPAPQRPAGTPPLTPSPAAAHPPGTASAGAAPAGPQSAAASAPAGPQSAAGAPHPPGAPSPGVSPAGPQPAAASAPAGPRAASPQPSASPQPDGVPPGADGSTAVPPAGPGAGGSDAGAAGNTFVFRRPTGTPEDGPASAAPKEDRGTLTFRAVTPRKGPSGAAPGTPAAPAQGPGFNAGAAAAARAAAAQAGAGTQPAAPAAPAAPSAPVSTPLTTGPGGGQSSWAQQVHRLAGSGAEEQPVAPWKPPVEDVFQAAARRQAAARPAALGKRLAARLLDTVVLAAVTAVAAVPLGTKAVDHVDEKIDAAKLSGETVTVWLLDGTTSVYLGIVLAVLLLFGVVYEALPTAKWGRTLGKRLLKLEVRDIEGHEPPAFGAALRRWLVYSIPGLLVVGVVGVVWCLFDRPWHQCWHDKAAHTFVAG